MLLALYTDPYEPTCNGSGRIISSRLRAEVAAVEQRRGEWLDASEFAPECPGCELCQEDDHD